MKDRIPIVQRWVHLVYMDEVVENDELMHSWLENRQQGRRTAVERPQVVGTPTKKGYDPSNIFRGFRVEGRQKYLGRNESLESNDTTTKLTWGGLIMNQVSEIVRNVSTCGFVACGLDDTDFDSVSFAHTSHSSTNENNSMQSGRNYERNEILPGKLRAAAFSFSLEDSVTNSSLSMPQASIPTDLAGFQPHLSPAYVEPSADTKPEALPDVETTESEDTEPMWEPFPTSREGPELTHPPSYQHQEKSRAYADNRPLTPTTTPTPKLEVPFEQQSGSPSNEDMGFIKDENDDYNGQEEWEVNVKPAIPKHRKIRNNVSLQPKTRRIHRFGFFRTNPRVPVDPSSLLVHQNSEKNKESTNIDADWILERDPAIVDLLGPEYESSVSRALQIQPSFTSSACTGSTRTTKRHKNGKKKVKKSPSEGDIQAAIKMDATRTPCPKRAIVSQ